MAELFADVQKRNFAKLSMVKEDTMDIVITQAPVAEEDKPHAADTSGETFSSLPATNNETEATE